MKATITLAEHEIKKACEAYVRERIGQSHVMSVVKLDVELGRFSTMYSGEPCTVTVDYDPYKPKDEEK